MNLLEAVKKALALLEHWLPHTDLPTIINLRFAISVVVLVVVWIGISGPTDLKGGVYSKLFWQQSHARNGWIKEWQPLYTHPALQTTGDEK